LIRKVWAKFDDNDKIECVCDEHHRKCEKESKCKEYVAKFIEVDRNQEAFDDAVAHLNKESEKLYKSISRFESQVSRSIKKFKV
jgi:hypothetical protein